MQIPRKVKVFKNTIDGPNILITGFAPHERALFAGDLIKIKDIQIINAYSVFANQIKRSSEDEIRFLVMDDSAANSEGVATVSVKPEIITDENNPYRNLLSPIPEGKEAVIYRRETNEITTNN